ncbi:MAG: outer membrane beta-barrel protein [Planctomycetota bacterium]|jgi:hypothetical protein
MMRTLVVSAIGVAGLLLALPAANAPGATFGVRFGPNLSEFDAPDTGEAHTNLAGELVTHRWGVSIGATAELGAGDRLRFETGLVYAQKGAKGDPNSEYFTGGFVGPDYYSDAEIRLDYVEIPILAKLRMAGGKAYVAGGLGIGFLTRAHMEYEYGTLSGGLMDKATVDLEDRMEDTDLSYIVGCGLSFKAGKGRMSIGFQFTKGFSDVSSDPVMAGKNKVFSAVLGYSF